MTKFTQIPRLCEITCMCFKKDTRRNGIMSHMPRLNRFSFSIDSFIFAIDQINLPSIEDVQYTFIDFSNIKVISCIDYFSNTNGRCYIYSYPSLLPYYGIITNNFPGGLFINVRVVSLYDKHQFEHEIFYQIKKSFPFMQRLSVNNDKPLNLKQFHELIDDNRSLSIIEYPFLNEVIIINVHDDYVERFLFHTKTYFQHNIDLTIKYESLQRVTHNFTRNETRINCAKINKLVLCTDEKLSHSLEEYFPCAKISCSRII